MASELLNGPGRLTREEMLRMIRIAVADSNHPFVNDMREFLDMEIDKVHGKKSYDHKRNQFSQKVNNQEIKGIVKDALTSEWQSLNDIWEEIGIEELSLLKISKVLKSLIDEQIVEKTTTRRTKDMPKEFHRKNVYRLKE